jgi:hypothetical protein
MIVFSSSKKPEQLILSPPISELEMATAATIMTRHKKTMDELQVEQKELQGELALHVNAQIYSGKETAKTSPVAILEKVNNFRDRTKRVNLEVLRDILSLFKILPDGVSAEQVRAIRYSSTEIVIKTEDNTYNFPVIASNPEGLERFLQFIRGLSEFVASGQQASSSISSQVDWMSGIEFEKHIAEVLKDNDYAVEQLGGSGDLGVDIIAEKRGLKYAIQCKRQESMVSRRAVSDAVAGMQHYACDQAVVITNNTFSPGAMQLAKSTSCILIDGKTLSRIMEQRPGEGMDVLSTPVI